MLACSNFSTFLYRFLCPCLSQTTISHIIAASFLYWLLVYVAKSDGMSVNVCIFLMSSRVLLTNGEVVDCVVVVLLVTAAVICIADVSGVVSAGDDARLEIVGMISYMACMISQYCNRSLLTLEQKANACFCQWDTTYYTFHALTTYSSGL